MELQLDEEETGKDFRLDLVSSLLGQQIAAGILNQTTTVEDHTKICPHPVLIKNICTKCGKQNSCTTSTIPFWYVYPDLSLSFNEVDRIRDVNLRTLLARKRLHLVLDLDHTLVHTRKFYKLTPEDRQFLRTKKYGIDHNLPGELGTLFKIGDGWMKLRPYVRDFLREASTMFDMTIYTLGCKLYAWNVAKLLDPEGAYFDKWRVVSREDCAVLDKHKKFLDVILEHERVTVVMDDNETVWEDYKTNVFKVIPYNFFSYFSPEDKVHDASPPRGSWSQLDGDESEENGVLARALDKLRAVHAAFFDDLGVKGVKNYGSKDVRDILQRVLMNQRPLTRNQKKHKAKKIDGMSRALQAAHL